MSYTSLKFLLFVIAVFAVYYILPKKYRWLSLLTGSLYFYYLFSGKYILFIIISTVITFIMGKVLQKREKKRKLILVISILLILSCLVVLKYNNFIGSLLNPILGTVKLKIPYYKFILPIGISYYTLDMIGYLTDIYRKKYEAEKNPLKLLTFFTYFPKIVEGPFCKYDDLSKTLFGENKFDYEKFKSAWVLIAFGFVKKLIIADKLGIFVNNVFTNNYGGVHLIMAMVFYTIQIYCDFSGSINIISGVSELFSVELPENFRRPFFSQNINEFWRRWHITLGEWLKNYIFYPVTFSKMNMKLNKAVRKWKSKHLSKFIITAFPLLFVWLVNGIWHGPSLQYILYGLYYYVLMMLGVLCKPLLDKLEKILKINTEVWSYKFFKIIRTCAIVCFGLFLFRCDGLEQFTLLLSKIGDTQVMDLNTLGLSSKDIVVCFFFFAIVMSTELAYELKINVREKLNEQNLVFRWIVYLFLIFSIILFGAYGRGYEAASFIYGGF